MFLKTLRLKNIGPFRDVSLSFENEDGEHCPVVIFTGENGTGKSVVIDAIRTAFKGLHGIERDIIPDKSSFLIECKVRDKGGDTLVSVNKLAFNGKPTGENPFKNLFTSAMTQETKVDWVVDYWSPDIPEGSYEIGNISSIDIKSALVGSLDKTAPNINLSKFISSIDYLQDSKKSEEASRGKSIYKLIKQIFTECVGEGSFQYVERESIKPIIKTHGQDVSLGNLSSGNILLVKHLVGLVSRMYGICRMNNMPLDQMSKMSGILLIDEIENHLHPKWQKSIIGIIRKHFPNLQIVLTTHSPFVISSVADAKIFVCVAKVDHTEIYDSTADYSNLPVDEVLNTPVFNVGPFNNEITDLLYKRKEAIKEGKMGEAEKYAQELLALNEEYFTFYKVNGQTMFYDNETH